LPIADSSLLLSLSLSIPHAISFSNKQELGKPTDLAIIEVIQQTFIDKVLLDVGLVVTIYDILEIGDGYVYHSDGGAHHKVVFRAVVFQPFPGEILVGKVSECTAEGLRVSLDFFEDVYLPSYYIPNPQHYNKEDELWVWHYDDGGGGKEMPLTLEKGHPIRVMVESIKFFPSPYGDNADDDAQGGGGGTENGGGNHNNNNTATVIDPGGNGGATMITTTTKRQHVPMKVISRIDLNAGQGLGMTHWYTTDE